MAVRSQMLRPLALIWDKYHSWLGLGKKLMDIFVQPNIVDIQERNFIDSELQQWVTSKRKWLSRGLISIINAQLAWVSLELVEMTFQVKLNPALFQPRANGTGGFIMPIDKPGASILGTFQ